MRKGIIFPFLWISMVADAHPIDVDKKSDLGSEGVIPFVSDHYSALPSLYDFEHAIEERLSDKVMRRFVMGAQMMLVEWTFKKGAAIPLHFHSHEQITWIIKGSVRVKSQGKTFIVKAGQVIVFPAYVPHDFLALEDTIDIDFFTPVRRDWFSNPADYVKNIQE